MGLRKFSDSWALKSLPLIENKKLLDPWSWRLTGAGKREELQYRTDSEVQFMLQSPWGEDETGGGGGFPWNLSPALLLTLPCRVFLTPFLSSPGGPSFINHWHLSPWFRRYIWGKPTGGDWLQGCRAGWCEMTRKWKGLGQCLAPKDSLLSYKTQPQCWSWFSKHICQGNTCTWLKITWVQRGAEYVWISAVPLPTLRITPPRPSHLTISGFRSNGFISVFLNTSHLLLSFDLLAGCLTCLFPAMAYESLAHLQHLLLSLPPFSWWK